MALLLDCYKIDSFLHNVTKSEDPAKKSKNTSRKSELALQGIWLHSKNLQKRHDKNPGEMGKPNW